MLCIGRIDNIGFVQPRHVGDLTRRGFLDLVHARDESLVAGPDERPVVFQDVVSDDFQTTKTGHIEVDDVSEQQSSDPDKVVRLFGNGAKLGDQTGHYFQGMAGLVEGLSKGLEFSAGSFQGTAPFHL